MRRLQKQLIAIFFSLTFVLASGLNANAKPLRLFGLGIGADTGYSQSAGLNTDANTNFVSEVSVRLDLLYLLGIDFSYNYGELSAYTPGQGLVFDAKYRVSGIFYLVPTSLASIYLKAGIGGQQVSELTSVQADGNSYHAGGGLEIYVTDNVAVSFEYLMLLPGAASIQNSLDSTTQEFTDGLGQVGGALDGTPGNPPSVSLSDFVSPNNFQAKAGLKLYF
jgi:opacity protein-like surface antigen